jgi:hypothetical protein
MSYTAFVKRDRKETIDTAMHPSGDFATLAHGLLIATDGESAVPVPVPVHAACRDACTSTGRCAVPGSRFDSGAVVGY